MAAAAPAPHTRGVTSVRAGSSSVPQISLLSRALWFMGGFDADILAEDDCSTIRAKYSCMGALVALTSTLALLSATYAVYTVFHNVYAAIPIGLVWATMIFFLDRFLVSSTRKHGTVKEYYSTLSCAYPFSVNASRVALISRLLLAALVGIVVAKPIEVRLLEPLVTRDAIDTKKEELKDNSVALSLLNSRVQAAQSAVAKEEDEVRRIQRERDRELHEGAGGRPAGDGPVWREIGEELRKAEERLARSNAARAEAWKELQKRQDELDNRVEERSGQLETERSFISDYMVLQQLAARRPEYASHLPIVSWFLTLLFVFIEMSPVLAKTLSSFDPYDASLQERENRAMLSALAASRADHQNAASASS